jgi:serine/threonine protein kinase
MEIMATTFLNLVHGDWLRRPPAWLEAVLLVLTGILIGGGLCRLKPLPALLVAVGIFLAVMLAFGSASYFTNFWFPWLVICGGQVPCALAWCWAAQTQPVEFLFERHPGYTLVSEKPFGAGASGKVWMVRNRIGELQALKEIAQAKSEHAVFFEREFNGITRYKPVSNEHTGLLHIDFVNSNEQQGYFYYVMELGDPLDPDWEAKGASYQPRDLTGVCSLEGGRLPVRECINHGIKLLQALEFLHQRGLVHCDIKPSNIIFVKGRPKLADVGLMSEARQESNQVGTPGYMPPPPEPTGTIVADIYAMGMVLYVISTGNKPQLFSELSTTLVGKPEFMRLNKIICQACQPAADQRYQSAAAMLAALRSVQDDLDAGGTQIIQK